MIKPLMEWVGKCSLFGGPDDHGVTPTEGLALYSPSTYANAPSGLFLPTQPPGTSGLARRLNPAALYCACRWDYRITGGAIALRRMKVRVSVRRVAIWVHPVDYGPNPYTGRVIDLSPGAAAALGVATDDQVHAALYECPAAVDEEELA